METRRSVMEFHLINHPLDCPVCDQAGECWLQIYYMRHGLYDPRMADEKVHKPKAMPLGPHVILDAERCILCSRCVRFCDEVTGTGELGIFHRGDHSEIGLFPGKTLENKYCEQCDRHLPGRRAHRPRLPVPGARLVPRLAPSRCAMAAPAAAMSRSTRAAGARITTRASGWPGSSRARMPRSTSGGSATRAATASTGSTPSPGSPRRPRAKRGRAVATTWDAALAALGAALRRYRPEEIGILASPQMSNEDLFALKRLADQLHLANVDHRVPPAAPGDQDDFLIRADKNPNTRGAELIGLSPGAGGLDGAGMIAAAAAGRLKLLWILHHDLSRSAWAPAQVEAALATAEMVVFQGTNANSTSAAAHLVLPSAAYVEREGTFTNFEGRVQRFRTALDALGEARPDWEVFSAARRGAWPVRPGAHLLARRPGVPGAGRGGARVCRHELPRPRRWRTGGRVMSGGRRPPRALRSRRLHDVRGAEPGRHLDLGGAQAVGDHAGSHRRQPGLDLRHPRHGAAPPPRGRGQDADEGRLHAHPRGPPALHAGAVRVGLLRARRLRLHPLRRHPDRRGANDRAAGGDAQRGDPLRARHAVDGRLRAHDGGLGLGQ